MKKLNFILGSNLILLSLCLSFVSNAQNDNTAAHSLGWELAAQAWTFNQFTFVESIDKMKSAGIYNIEMFPGQTIGGNFSGKTNFQMDHETRTKLLKFIRKKGMKLVNYGVVNAKSREEWIQNFEFAKEMGITTIITEADSVQLNYLEAICEFYQIKIALHNHPNPGVFKKPSIYWNPDFTLNQIIHRNKYIGICPDVGHWFRSGLDPLISLRKCKGRILSVHIKDLVPGSVGLCGFHDVPWGTGLCNFSGLMHELKKINYAGYITLEYDYKSPNTFLEVKESVNNFKRLTSRIIKE